jgi:hypothetical protein
MDLFSTDDMTSDEIVRASWLRSMELIKWPAFICQPLLPIGFFFWGPLYTLGTVIVASWAWVAIRQALIKHRLAVVGCLWVKLKWLSMVVMGIVCLLHREFLLAGLTAATPLFAMMLTAVTPGTDILPVQKELWRQVGFEPENVEYNERMDELKMFVRDGN